MDVTMIGQFEVHDEVAKDRELPYAVYDTDRHTPLPVIIAKFASKIDAIHYAQNLAGSDDEDLDCDDSMDGDHGSALASAGWGTDEDYNCYSEYPEDY